MAKNGRILIAFITGVALSLFFSEQLRDITRCEQGIVLQGTRPDPLIVSKDAPSSLNVRNVDYYNYAVVEKEFQSRFELENEPLPLLKNGFRKVIWFFWEGKVEPLHILSFLSWKKYARDWQLRGVNFKNMKQYMDETELPKNFNALSVQHKADCIRFVLLVKFGGVWNDASVLFTRELEDWFFPFYNLDFSGFYTPQFSRTHGDEFVENWFLSSRVGGLFLTKWRDTLFSELDKLQPGQKLLSILNRTDTHNLPGGFLKEYLTSHIVMLFLRQNDKDVQRLFKDGKIRLRNSEDGPFFVLARCSYYFPMYARITAEQLLKHEDHHERVPFVKFIGANRGVVTKAMLAKKEKYGMRDFRTFLETFSNDTALGEFFRRVLPRDMID